MIINSEQAISRVTPNTLVVVTDVNKPSMTECEELLSLAKSIVVFDHHRQSDEVIENATLSYIEPYASSACEMIAEILQYIEGKVKLRPIEADASRIPVRVCARSSTTTRSIQKMSTKMSSARYYVLTGCSFHLQQSPFLPVRKLVSVTASSASPQQRFRQVYPQVSATTRKSTKHTK